MGRSRVKAGLTQPVRAAARRLFSHGRPDAADLSASTVVPILTTRHCLFIAERLRRLLESVGIRSEVIFERPEGGFQPHPHIVICPQMHSTLPATYYAFQLEQSTNPRWFVRSYLRRLRKGVAVFDYSLTNLAYLERKRFDRRNVFYVPITVDPSLIARQPEPESEVETEYDVVFYGDDHSPRRQRFLSALSESFTVKIINNLFGEELYAELQRAKVVVNIHYYENALLETPRLAEALSRGAVIVSESSTDIIEYQGLQKVVDFVPLGDVDAMVERVAHWVGNDVMRQQRKASTREFLIAAPDLMEFYFLRFLLAQNAISRDLIDERCARHDAISS